MIHQAIESHRLIRLFQSVIIRLVRDVICKNIAIIENQFQIISVNCRRKFSLFCNNSLLIIISTCVLMKKNTFQFFTLFTIDFIKFYRVTRNLIYENTRSKIDRRFGRDYIEHHILRFSLKIRNNVIGKEEEGDRKHGYRYEKRHHYTHKRDSRSFHRGQLITFSKISKGHDRR